jgi:hypothetical protein
VNAAHQTQCLLRTWNIGSVSAAHAGQGYVLKHRAKNHRRVSTFSSSLMQRLALLQRVNARPIRTDRAQSTGRPAHQYHENLLRRVAKVKDRASLSRTQGQLQSV